MIPLLDIMIVVLFVFATIEEGEAVPDDRAKVESLEADNQRLRAEVASAASVRTAAELERDELRSAVDASREEIAEALEANRQREIMKALLGEAQVIEVEIEGQPTEHDITNPCCYRRFSPDAAWKSCGDVPTSSDDRARWLDDGASGLLAELNATGKTPTMVIVRQERDAAYNISDDVGKQIRDRTPIQKTYAVTVETPVEHCNASPDP